MMSNKLEIKNGAQQKNTSYFFAVVLILLTSIFLNPVAADAATISRPSNNIGLVGYWDFEIGKNGDTAYDRSGQGNNGTLTNATTSEVWVDSKDGLGQAINFDGEDDYVDTGTALNIANSSFTISAWAKRDSIGTWDILVYQDADGVGNTNSTLHFGWEADSDFTCAFWGNDLDTIPSYKSLEWHHWICTYDATTNDRVIYRDGVNLVSDVASADYQGSGTLIIGEAAAPASSEFSGSIDEVRIYNRALSTDEVRRLYKNTGPTVKTVSREGLVGHWTFEDGTGVIAGDSSGNGNDGTLENMTEDDWVPGKRGTALDFDGSDDYVDIGTNIAPADEISICAWVYRKDDREGPGGDFEQDIIVRSSTANSGNFVFEFNREGSNPILTFNTPGGAASFLAVYDSTDSRPFALNEWMHLCVVFSDQDLSSQALYYNGESLQLEVTESNSLATNTETVFIGGRSGGTDVLNGFLDDVRIYDRVLSPDEILSLYENSASIKLNSSRNNRLTDGLVGLWSFDGKDMYQTTAIDRSGQGNDGTLTNGPVPTIGKIGQALEFDGGDDYVSVSSLNNFEDDYTDFAVSAWVYPTGGGAIISEDLSVSTKEWRINVTNTQPSFTYINDSGTYFTRTTTGSPITSSTWNHVTWVVDRTGVGLIEIYVNGVEETLDDSSITDLTWDVNDNSAPFYIAKTRSASDSFNGKLDNIRLYSRTLSADEVWELYNMGR